MTTRQHINMESSDFQPMNETVLVKPDDLITETKSAGGIIMIHEKKTITGDRPTSGTIVAKSNDTENFAVDDFVLWPEISGIDFTFTDGDFLLLDPTHIIGKRK